MSEPSQDAAPKLVQIAFPDKITPFVWLAMVIGLLLVGVAFVPFISGAGAGAPSSVLLGAGIGIILSAFGGQATLAGKTFVFAGVAAVAVGLIWFLEHRADVQSRALTAQAEALAKAYTIGTILDVPVRFNDYDITIKFRKTVLGFQQKSRRSAGQYDFVIFGSDIDTSNATLSLEPTGSEDGISSISVAINSNCVMDPLKKSRPVEWRLRTKAASQGEVVEVIDGQRNDVVIGRFGAAVDVVDASPPDSCLDTTGAAASSPEETTLSSFASSLFDELWSAAHAQTTETADTSLSDAQIQSYLVDLTSEDVTIRRGARDSLANASVESVPTLVAALHQGISDYRTKLGITVALTEMLREDKGKAVQLDDRLSDEDFRLLLDLAGDDDRTVRIYATEFLFDLESERVARLAIERAAATDANATARYNWLFVSQGGWMRMSAGDRATLQPNLTAARAATGSEGTQTLELIDKIEESAAAQ